MMVLDSLIKLANKLDTLGLYDEANEIDALLTSYADIWDEMGRMEKSPPNRPGPQQRMMDAYEKRKRQQQGMPKGQFNQLWQDQQKANQPKKTVQKQQKPIPNKQQPEPNPEQKKPNTVVDPKDLQNAAGKIRQQVFNNPKVPKLYKNTGTLMRVMQNMIMKGQAKDVNSASQLLTKRLGRFK